MSNEADTCRQFVVPALQAAGWDRPPHGIQEQRYFTDGRIRIMRNGTAKRGRRRRADYLLRYGPDLPIAVVEAKASYRHPAEGMQQAKEYAQTLGLPFAFSTNGTGFVQWDVAAGTEVVVEPFPSPEELWSRYRDACALGPETAEKLAVPGRPDPAKRLRYYQEIAINRPLQGIPTGNRRLLLTSAPAPERRRSHSSSAGA